MVTAYLHRERDTAPIVVNVTEYRKVIIHDGRAYLHNDISNSPGYYTLVTCTFLDEHEQEIPQ